MSTRTEETTGRVPTRRDLLFGGALLTGILAQAGCLVPDETLLAADGEAPLPDASPPSSPADLLARARRIQALQPTEMPLPPRDKQRAREADLQAAASDIPARDLDPALREPLLARTGYGTTQLDRALYSLLGYEAYLERQLNHEEIDDSEVDQMLAPYATLTMSAEEMYALGDFGQPILELLAARTIRAIYSQRQLYERMVEFWTDHFNISILDEIENVLKPVDDREVIRKHALGNFRDLLKASAMSPGMLWYLDNYGSFVGAINENYARELLELHTMGVDGGYTQQDVEEVARCFTGWTISGAEGSWGTFLFYGPLHDFGEKTVLGTTIPAGQRRKDGLDVINLLAAHPSTARFISTKMTRWLWGYEPPAALIDEVTDTYLATDGDIKSMIRVILSPQWLLKATPKYKRPFHYLVSIARVTQPDFSDILGPVYWADVMGHVPYFWPAPNGYADSVGYWAGHLLPRWSMPADLANDTAYGMLIDPTYIVGDATEPAEIVEQINLRFFGGNLPDTERDGLIAFLQPNPPNLPPPRRIRDAIGLALASPTFQWY